MLFVQLNTWYKIIPGGARGLFFIMHGIRVKLKQKASSVFVCGAAVLEVHHCLQHLQQLITYQVRKNTQPQRLSIIWPSLAVQQQWAPAVKKHYVRETTTAVGSDRREQSEIGLL